MAREDGFCVVAVETDNQTLTSFLQKGFAPRCTWEQSFETFLMLHRLFI